MNSSRILILNRRESISYQMKKKTLMPGQVMLLNKILQNRFQKWQIIMNPSTLKGNNRQEYGSIYQEAMFPKLGSPERGRAGALKSKFIKKITALAMVTAAVSVDIQKEID